MRTSAGEKEKLKEAMLSQALPHLKEVGTDGAPVDQIMKKLGLSSGALYSHFKSKDDFFSQVILRELDRLADDYQKNIKGADFIRSFIESYLSEKHILAVSRGCLFVALGNDLHRSSADAKALYEKKIERLLSLLSRGLPWGSAEERLAKMKFIFSSMVGALVLSRSMKTKETARSFLEITKNHLLQLLDPG